MLVGTGLGRARVRGCRLEKTVSAKGKGEIVDDLTGPWIPLEESDVKDSFGIGELQSSQVRLR